MLIVCILLALLCAGLAFWVWAQRRSLREAAYRLRALEDTGSTARVRLAVPNSAAEELLDEVNRLLELRQRGQEAEFDAVLSDILRRDEQDRTRAVAPLRQAEDAVLLDTTELDRAGSLEALLAIVREGLSR